MDIVFKSEDGTEVLSEFEARDLTSKINSHLESMWDLVKVAYLRRAWIPLGYSSWDVYCAAEFTGSHIRIPREERQEVVVSLRESGMSMRAIASVTGVHNRTVERDLESAAANAAPAEQSVTGIDGRVYSPSRSKSQGKIIDAEIVEEWSSEEEELRKLLESGETVVVSLREDGHPNLIAWAISKGLFERIDRRSPWGNPFEMGPDGDRDTVIFNYDHHYIPFKPSLLSRLDELRGKALGCWCAPKKCHGDSLKARL